MRNLTWAGSLLAESSIAHGGQTSGVLHQLRRETLVTEDGTLLSGVPVVSGSVIRGVLRRHAATMMEAMLQEITQEPRLPYQVLNALRSGGHLRERRANEEAITGGKQAELRSLLPSLSLFGVGIGTRLVSGRIMVDKGIPLSKETAHLAARNGIDVSTFKSLPSIWQLIQRETYSRKSDILTGDVGHLVSNPDDIELPRGGGQMRYTHETIPMGTVLLHSISAEAATPVEQSFMLDLIEQWSRAARIGGQIARGAGRVTPRYDLRVTAVDGRDAPIELLDWREHMREHRDDVREVLTWL